MIEEGEYLIVMEEGPDIRILARLEHYALAEPAWMAAKFKFPRENLLLRKKAQIMQRHGSYRTSKTRMTNGIANTVRNQRDSGVYGNGCFRHGLNRTTRR